MQVFSKADSFIQKEIVRRVIELSFIDFSYSKIVEEIKKEFNINLSKGTLSYWFNHNKVLFGGINKFFAEPSKELSYFLGVMFGDGAISYYKKSGDYCIKLDVIDKDFAIIFVQTVSKLLNKSKDYPVHKSKRGTFEVNIRSKNLYNFTKKCKEDFSVLKKFVSPFPKEFIRGLADSEGCPCISARVEFKISLVVAVSTNYELLLFVKQLLQSKFNIVSILYLIHKKGKADSVIDGRIILRTKDLYQLKVSKFRYIKSFSEIIGFSIKRKHQKLIDCVTIFENSIVSERIVNWRNNYYKNKKLWVTKNEQ